MLREALSHVFSDCPKDLKRLGVLYDLIALEARARRMKSAWTPHYVACHRTLETMIQRTARRRLAVVYGSGLMLETPMGPLADAFERVVCVDLHHRPQVRRRAATLRNVSLLDHDVTGALGPLAGAGEGRCAAPARADPPHLKDADLIVSANCLSQLASIPVSAAKGVHAPEARRRLSAAIMRAHLRALTAAAGAVGLISDHTRRLHRRKDNVVTEEIDLLNGVSLPNWKELGSWIWDLAPAPEERRDAHIRHAVRAFYRPSQRQHQNAPPKISSASNQAGASGV